ncbi:MAG: hypothetical protein ACREHG_06785 [Candidatus Saccharimonadales bacterium]
MVKHLAGVSPRIPEKADTAANPVSMQGKPPSPIYESLGSEVLLGFPQRTVEHITYQGQ